MPVFAVLVVLFISSALIFATPAWIASWYFPWLTGFGVGHIFAVILSVAFWAFFASIGVTMLIVSIQAIRGGQRVTVTPPAGDVSN